MTEITLRVPDTMVALIENLAAHVPGMEVVATGDSMGDDERDLCFRKAIVELKEEGVIRKRKDYAWIMAALEQGLIAEYEGFYSPQSFIDYMKQVGIELLPVRTTLYRAYTLIGGEYPDWTFKDKPNDNEALRRKNIVVRFKSAFYRAKRAVCNSHCNN